MRTNRTILILGAATLLVLLIGLCRVSPRTNRPKTETPTEPAPPVRFAEHHAPPSPESAQLAPTTPPATIDTNTPPADAADIYRKAFALLDALSKEEKNILSDWTTHVDSSVEAELCAQLKPITALAHEAAAVPNCDWGLGKLTVDTPMPHWTRARSLARALVWNAAHCRRDESLGVADDLEATLRLGQTIAQQMIIGHLVDLAIEGLATSYLSSNAWQLSADVAIRVGKLFNDDRYEESLARALEAEADMFDNTADKLALASPDEIRSNLEAMGASFPSLDQAQFIEAIRQVAELEREYVQMLTVSGSPDQAWLDKVNAAQEANPLVKEFWPALDRIVDKTRAAEVQSAMVSAALGVFQNGLDALPSHLDPASGQAFVYRETADGFELESAYQRDGKPVVMSFRTH